MTRIKITMAVLSWSVAISLASVARAAEPASDPQTGWWPAFVPNVAVPGPAAPVPAGTEQLVFEGAECAGISG